MQILFEDNLITVCIKQPGVSSEETANTPSSPASVPAQLRDHWSSPDAYVGVIHRLDLAVGGVMVYARTPAAAAALSRQVADRTMEKEYLCLCAGVPAPAQGQMQDYLFKDSRSRKVFPVKKARKGAKKALLDYTVLAEGLLPAAAAACTPQGDMTPAADQAHSAPAKPETVAAVAAVDPSTPPRTLAPQGDTAPAADGNALAPAAYTPAAAQPVALCRVLLHTGRTHQIRVQFASRKHPLLGDGKYGSRIKGPIALQCSRIAFDHPKTGRRMEFTLPAPTHWPLREP